MEYLRLGSAAAAGSSSSSSSSSSPFPSFPSSAGGGGGQPLFAQSQLSTHQDVVAATTHTQDNARMQQFHFGQLDLIHDPGRRDITWALNNNATTYESSVGGGAGLNPNVLDVENQLVRAPTENQRQLPPRTHAERNVNPRLMLTVPYLGRGSVDPALEFRLQVGVLAPATPAYPEGNSVPVEGKTKGRSSVSDVAAAAQYDYDAFARDTLLARANQPLPSPDQHGFGDSSYYGPLPALGGFAPRHTFEEQTNGLTAFGENTRITKYSSASASYTNRRA